MSNPISTFILATSLKAALGHVDKAGLVKKLAEDIDNLADSKLGGRSEKFQEDLVRMILLPLCRELMYEDKSRFCQILESEQHGNFGSAQRQPFRGSDLISGELGQVPGKERSKVQAQNFVPKVC